MLYLSKRVADTLSDKMKHDLSLLSPERQTLFECYYCRFSSKTLQSPIIIKALYECVKETNLVK